MDSASWFKELGFYRLLMNVQTNKFDLCTFYKALHSTKSAKFRHSTQFLYMVHIEIIEILTQSDWWIISTIPILHNGPKILTKTHTQAVR